MEQKNAFFIDSRRKQIREVRVNDYRDIMKHLEATAMSLAAVLSDRSTLYVDDEGFSRPQEFYFRIPTWRPDQSFAGHGLLVGPEVEGAEGYSKPGITKREVVAEVKFISRAVWETMTRARSSP